MLLEEQVLSRAREMSWALERLRDIDNCSPISAGLPSRIDQVSPAYGLFSQQKTEIAELWPRNLDNSSSRGSKT